MCGKTGRWLWLPSSGPLGTNLYLNVIKSQIQEESPWP